VIILYSLLLFLGIAGTRLSFRMFPLLLKKPRTAPVPVLIYGAGDGGEVVVRECRRNPGVPYSPIGFIDDDVRKHGATMLGLTVLGDVNRLPEVLDQTKAQGLILSSARITAGGKGERILAICQERNVWVKHMRLDFVDGTES
jgi:UDP-GlcNAc:undecaprenyl-phosphate GlcNAc-1-phosphate transferase